MVCVAGLGRRCRTPVRSRARMQLPAGWVASNREDRIAEAAAREPGCMYERLAEAVYGRRGGDFFTPRTSRARKKTGERPVSAAPRSS